jgi:Flp pilus assembly protein TadG
MMLVHKAVTIADRAASGFRRYLRDESAVTAVEMGFVAAPFFYLLCGILEVSAMFASNVLLDHGVMEATRRIRTLEFQKTGGSAAAFKQLVCDSTYDMLDCAGSLSVDVKTFQDFDAANTGTPMLNGELDKSQLMFDPGAAGSIVVAKVYYEWEIVTPFFDNIWNNAGAGKRLLESAAAFRNEP